MVEGGIIEVIKEGIAYHGTINGLPRKTFTATARETMEFRL